MFTWAGKSIDHCWDIQRPERVAWFPCESKDFTVNAPQALQTNDSQSDSSQAAPTLEGQRVLLAEDCPDQGRLYLEFLRQAGAEVTLECSGQSAVDAVRKMPTHYDAVVMDFQMPELDGLDATKQLRELGYSGPIIAVTAFGSDELRSSWRQAGCVDFLEKPLDQHKFVGTVLRHATAARKTIEA